MLDPLALGRQQLYELRLVRPAGRLLHAGAFAAARLARGGAVHGHVCSSVCRPPGSPVAVGGPPAVGLGVLARFPTAHGVGVPRPNRTRQAPRRMACNRHVTQYPAFLRNPL
ncbi:hypothetical protein GCM10010357_50260 [Streptomyces luteireticuli]|uniref:Uncharacterized protein n=1 Tax=Streptomyces luteireticuli TaxID=173858 RepID=A0ABP3IT20_9ACTN